MAELPPGIDGLLLRPELSLPRLFAIFNAVSRAYTEQHPPQWPVGQTPLKAYCQSINERYNKPLFSGGSKLSVSNTCVYEEHLMLDLQQFLFLREEGPEQCKRGTVPGWMGEGMAQGMWERLLFEHIRDRDYSALFSRIAGHPWQRHDMKYQTIDRTVPEHDLPHMYAVMLRVQPDTLSALIRTTVFSERSVVSSETDDWRRTEEYVWQ